jgi:hypothetical protein
MAPTPESIRSQLLADPDSTQLAEQLGVPLEEYVQQVVHFVTNPQEEPQLLLVEDEDLRGQGLEPPDAEAMARHLEEAVALASASDVTEFTPAEMPSFVLSEAPQAPSDVAPFKVRPELKSELDAQLRNIRLNRW